MFREQVADHYRNKGYRLHEQVKIRGESGSVHACDIVAQGPLGNLVIQFEDEGGTEGPELAAMGRAARDVGAACVLAIEEIHAGLQQRALQAGVVLLDRQALEAPPPVDPSPADEPEYPAWPDPNRTPTRADPGIWTKPRAQAAEPAEAEPEPQPIAPLPAMEPAAPRRDGFGWLPQEAEAVVPVPVAPIPEAKREAILGLRVVILTLVAGAVAGAVYFGLSSL